ncbi:MAG: hypothetical protein HEP71_34225 [Roseivirga sp.]|nr:hypothetical protein [Roseivirga sp.]
MGYKKNDKCIEKAYEDERLFVLMARDGSSPTVIGEWIKQNITTQPREKLIEALDCAIDMSQRQSEFFERKQSDVMAKKAHDLNKYGMCKDCSNKPATHDWNGSGHYLCESCGESADRDFDDEYR